MQGRLHLKPSVCFMVHVDLGQIWFTSLRRSSGRCSSCFVLTFRLKPSVEVFKRLSCWVLIVLVAIYDFTMCKIAIAH